MVCQLQSELANKDLDILINLKFNKDKQWI